MIRTSIRLVAGVAAGALLLSGLSAAPVRPRARGSVRTVAPSNDLSGTSTYEVQPGDSLRKLFNNYFLNRGDQAAYREVWKTNHIVNPDHLTPGSKLVIPRKYLNLVPARAVVAAFRGDVTIGSRPAKINAVATEGTRVVTGPNSAVSLMLEDGSLISLPSQSAFVLDRLRLVLLTGELEHVFRLEAGRSEFVVTPARGPASRFQVKTPVAVSAVRGTEFRVAVEDNGAASLAEVLKDNVDVMPVSGSGGTQRVPEGFGAKASKEGVGKPVKLLAYPPVQLPLVQNADKSLTFNLKAIENATRYHLQIASDVTFRDIRDEVFADKPSLTVLKTPVGSYYVRVSAIDAQGFEGIAHIYPFENFE